LLHVSFSSSLFSLQADIAPIPPPPLGRIELSPWRQQKVSNIYPPIPIRFFFSLSVNRVLFSWIETVILPKIGLREKPPGKFTSFYSLQAPDVLSPPVAATEPESTPFSMVPK